MAIISIWGSEKYLKNMKKPIDVYSTGFGELFGFV